MPIINRGLRRTGERVYTVDPDKLTEMLATLRRNHGGLYKETPHFLKHEQGVAITGKVGGEWQDIGLITRGTDENGNPGDIYFSVYEYERHYGAPGTPIPNLKITLKDYLSPVPPPKE